jgi:hypothetical protein
MGINGEKVNRKVEKKKKALGKSTMPKEKEASARRGW